MVPELNLIKILDFYDFPEVKNSLYVSPGIIYMKFTPSELAHSIHHYYTIKSKNKIVFSDYYEAPTSKQLLLMNEIITILCNRYNHEISNFIFVTGCLPTEKNKQKLDDLFIKYNLHPIKKIIYPFFEEEWSCNIHTTKCDLNKLHEIKLKKKNSLYFVGALRAHRVYVLSKLIELNLIDRTFFSVLSPTMQLQDALNCNDPRYPGDMIFTNKEKLKSYIMSLPIKLPFSLTAGAERHDRQHELTREDIDLFAESYFSIIGETSFFKNDEVTDKTNHWNFHLDYTFCTEKTFRAIACLHPFLLVTRPYTLRALREMGYKTFNPYIDESYDEIEDDDLRLIKIVETIEKLYNKTDNEWLEFQHNVYPIVLHNFNHLLTIFKSDKYINVNTYSTTRGQI